LLDTPTYYFCYGIGKIFKGFWSKKQYLYNILSALLILIILCSQIFPALASGVAQKFQDSVCLHIGMALGCPDGIGTTSMLVDGNTATIGVSDGHSSFDHQTPAEQDVENKISRANAAIASSQHITLVVATTLSRTLDDMSQSSTEGLEDLRGAYLKQQEYNNDPSHPIKLRLLMANVGTRSMEAVAVPQVVRQLVRLAEEDSTLRGVIGLPTSAGTKEALDTRDALTAWHIFPNVSLPFISPSATSDQLSNRTLFYRVVTTDKQQARDLAAFAESQVRRQGSFSLNKPFRIAVLGDTSDSYSGSLESDFSSDIEENYQDMSAIAVPYTVGNTSKLASSVQKALDQHADAIFFAGYADDLNVLISTLFARHHPDIPILGGDGLYNIYGYVNTSSAQVFSTVYSSPLETSDPFIATYTSTFGEKPPILSGPGTHVPPHSLLDPHSILSYEAALAFLATLDKALSQAPGFPSQGTFNSTLATVSFNQISGAAMSFQNTSDPTNEPIYILCEGSANTPSIAATFDAGGHVEQQSSSSPPWQC
jgi:ABC-type branched-subunit amino acid transport system substrate-binding protein